MITSADGNRSRKSDKFQNILSMSPGDEGIVITMRLGSELQGRLMGLGLFVGSKVRVLQGGNGKNKPLLLAVGNTRFAIEREIAETIMIEQIASKV